MINFYYWTCGVVALIASTLLFLRRTNGNKIKNDELVKLRFDYLIVVAFMSAGDWLQGPIVYALYEDYGFEKFDIAFLFIVGFLSSAIGGVFIGTLVDRVGRRNGCMTYAIIYIISCFLKHFRSFKLLIIGRILGGVATSLLFSSFESWYISEHNSRGLPEGELVVTFGVSTGMNSLIAIGCGFIAQVVVHNVKYQVLPNFYIGGFITPFDIAIICLAIGMFLIRSKWGENWGTRHKVESWSSSLNLIKNDRSILLLGLTQGLFESAMYCFVFVWTPALGQGIPHGVIFATFMIAIAIGSLIFSRFEKPVLVACFAGGVALMIALVPDLRFLGFVSFELCCGIYFPSMASLKSKIVPENFRTTIYNLYRVPLNIVVVFVLVSNFSINMTIKICAGLLFAAAVALHQSSIYTQRENIL